MPRILWQCRKNVKNNSCQLNNARVIKKIKRLKKCLKVFSKDNKKKQTRFLWSKYNFCIHP